VEVAFQDVVIVSVIMTVVSVAAGFMVGYAWARLRQIEENLKDS
jgi:ABC-type glycerol-3-phosphate transport system permease component